MLAEIHVGFSADTQPQSLDIIPTYGVFQSSYVYFIYLDITRGERHQGFQCHFVSSVIVQLCRGGIGLYFGFCQRFYPPLIPISCQTFVVSLHTFRQIKTAIHVLVPFSSKNVIAEHCFLSQEQLYAVNTQFCIDIVRLFYDFTFLFVIRLCYGEFFDKVNPAHLMHSQFGMKQRVSTVRKTYPQRSAETDISCIGRIEQNLHTLLSVEIDRISKIKMIKRNTCSTQRRDEIVAQNMDFILI